MILQVDTNAKTVELAQADDCTSFRILVTGSQRAADIDECIAGRGRMFGENAWIDITSLEAMADGQVGDDWAAKFRTFIDECGRNGRLNDERNYILAPVEPA